MITNDTVFCAELCLQVCAEYKIARLQIDRTHLARIGKRIMPIASIPITRYIT